MRCKFTKKLCEGSHACVVVGGNEVLLLNYSAEIRKSDQMLSKVVNPGHTQDQFMRQIADPTGGLLKIAESAFF